VADRRIWRKTIGTYGSADLHTPIQPSRTSRDRKIYPQACRVHGFPDSLVLFVLNFEIKDILNFIAFTGIPQASLFPALQPGLKFLLYGIFSDFSDRLPFC